MKQNTRIEIFFWLAAFVVFSPRIFLEMNDLKLKEATTPFTDSNWTVKDEAENIIYENLKVPQDLRWKEQHTDRRAWIFEKKVDTQALRGQTDVGVVLGKIGDADYTTFNDCTLGSTGLNRETMEQETRQWTHLRTYQVPSSCIQFPTSLLRVHIYKWGGPAWGIIGGPIGFGKYTDIRRLADYIDFFRFEFFAVCGFGLCFFIGIQYFFIYLLAPTRKLYGVFSGASITTGIYLLLTSDLPEQLIGHAQLLKKLLLSSAELATIFFIYFFYLKTRRFSKNVLIGYLIFTLPQTIGVWFVHDHQSLYRVYESWYGFLLLGLFVTYGFVFFGKGEKPRDVYFTKYFIAYTIFLLCAIHDVIITVFGLSSAYMFGYAYVFFVNVLGLTLSKEYSDAFEHVEDQVQLRTNELNHAYIKVTETQKLKDEQAREFSRDIRSPLSALQVLQDSISKNISQDQITLFKDTIVRINDLANTIVPDVVETGEKKKDSMDSVFLWTLVDKLVSEKREQYENIHDFVIEAKSVTPLFDIYAVCDEMNLRKILSEVVDRSVATRKLEHPYIISLLLEKKANVVEIVIQDNGKGTAIKFDDPSKQAALSEKDDMSLPQIKKVIQSWLGDIHFYSTENIGNTITLELPAGEKPSWLIAKLDLKLVDNLVVLDGQRYVIDTWKQKLRSLDKNFNLYWAKNADEWNKYKLEDLLKKETMFLIDQDLSTYTGLDFIQKFRLGSNAVLVTANEDDKILRVKAEALHISILPKSLIYAVPIEI